MYRLGDYNMGTQQDTKIKLTVDEQINDMIQKNVKFDLYSIEEAYIFISTIIEYIDKKNRQRFLLARCVH